VDAAPMLWMKIDHQHFVSPLVQKLRRRRRKHANLKEAAEFEDVVTCTPWTFKSANFIFK